MIRWSIMATFCAIVAGFNFAVADSPDDYIWGALAVAVSIACVVVAMEEAG